MSARASTAITVDSRLEETRRLGGWLEITIPEAELAPARAEIELALVELISNIIRHGFDNRAGAPIALELERTSGAARISIHDGGKPVPLCARKLAETALDFDPIDLHDLPVGGIGLALAIAAMDDFAYEERAGANVTRLEKQLRAAD